MSAILNTAVKFDGIQLGKDSLVQYRVLDFGNNEMKIEQKTPGLLFCSVYSTFEQKSKDVASFANGFTVERELYCNGKAMDSTRLFRVKTGDKITAKYKVYSSQIRSFVKITAHRAACLAPVSVYSGYKHFLSGFRYYMECKKDRTEYYFLAMADGHHILEEEFVVTQSGEFNGSMVEIESLYSNSARGNTRACRMVSDLEKGE